MTNQDEDKPPQTKDNSESQDRAPGTEAQHLRIRVVDHSKDDRPAVNIKVPMGVVKFGLTMAQAFSPEVKKANLDWDSINAMIQAGELGKIVDVEDEAQHKTIEVWLE
jgi:hypothetical protein